MIGYWRLDDATEDRIPSGLETGYAGRAVGRVMVNAIPAIDRFLVRGELEKEAELAYGRGAVAFEGQDYATATHAFESALSFVADFQDAAANRDRARYQWNLSMAEAAYVEATTHLDGGDAIRAYWAFDRAIEKVPNYKDAAGKRQRALEEATYRVGLFVLSSERIREQFKPTAGEETGRLGRWAHAIRRAGRTNVFNKPDRADRVQRLLYSHLLEGIEKAKPPYVELVGKDEVHRLIERAGANARLAHRDQVIEACRSNGVDVLLFGELTTAYTLYSRESEEKKAFTVKKEEYTDADGKKKKREVKDRHFTYHRVNAESKMECVMTCQLVNTSSGTVIWEGSVRAADEDEVDFVDWNNFKGVRKNNLRYEKDGKIRRLPSDELSVFDTRSTLATEDGLLDWGAQKMGLDLTQTVLERMRYYSPGVTLSGVSGTDRRLYPSIILALLPFFDGIRMKITSIRALQPGTDYSPDDWRTWVGQILVVIETEDGLTGYGVGGGGKAGIHVIDEVLSRTLLGADATRVEDLWDEMYRSTLAFGRKGIAVMAISGVDLALWDLRAKREEKALVEVLGGEAGKPIRAYKTGFSSDEVIDTGAQGFSALKFHAGVLPGEDLGDVVGDIKRVRETLGPDIRLMGDAGMKMDADTTLRVAEQLAPYDLYWLEEPLQPDDFEGYARLRDECAIPIASGEHEYTAKAFEVIIEEKLHAFVQPDVSWCGGMTELLKIYKMAEGTDVVVCPHRGAEAWSIHAIGALGNPPFAESGRPWMTWVKGTPEIGDGEVSVTERPGFGVWFEEEDLH